MTPEELKKYFVDYQLATQTFNKDTSGDVMSRIDKNVSAFLKEYYS